MLWDVFKCKENSDWEMKTSFLSPPNSSKPTNFVFYNSMAGPFLESDQNPVALR